MLADWELAEHRADAEERMTSRVAVMRKTGAKVQDEGSGREVPEWATVESDLPFRSDAAGEAGSSRAVRVGGIEWMDATGVGHMPATFQDLADGDLLVVLTGEWPGEVFRVVKAVRYDQKTARRVPIAQHQRPEEWEA